MKKLLIVFLFVFLFTGIAEAANQTEYFYKGAGRRSIYWSGEQAQEVNGVIYMVFQGADEDPYAITYTIATDTYSAAVKVGTNPLTDDAHGSPTMLVDSSGFIHVTFGSHGGVQKYSKSTNTYDISAWTAMSDITANSTYPSLFEDSTGDLWVVYRAGTVTNDWAFRISTNGGTSWGAESSFINGDATNGYYGTTVMDSNDDLHHGFMWVDIAGGSTRYDVYYMWYDSSGSKWYNAAGTELTVPLSKADADTYCKVRDTGSNQVGVLPKVGYDGTNPYVLFSEGLGQSYTYKMGKYSGGWSISTVAATGNSRRDNYILDIKSSTDIDAYVNTGGFTSGEVGHYGDGGGDITMYNWNGSAWGAGSTIMSNGSYMDNPKMVKNYTTSGKMIVSQYPPSTYYNDHELYMWDGTKLITNDTSDGTSWLSGYDSASKGARRKIIIRNEQVPADISNYPVYVKMPPNDNLVAKAQASGNDIAFTTSDGTTLLDYDRRSYDSSTGELHAFVEMDITAATDTVFYMYYGNPDASDQQNKAGVWDSNYKLVLHMDETTGQHIDSSASGNDSTSINVTTQGSATTVAVGADRFVVGSSNKVQIADDATLDATGDFTYEILFKIDKVTSSATVQNLLNKRDAALPSVGIVMYYQGSVTKLVHGAIDVGAVSTTLSSTSTVDDDGWHHVAFTRSGTTTALYVDGVSEDTDTTAGNDADLSNANDFKIGANRNDANFLDGDVASVRMSNTVRDADWLLTTSNNYLDFIEFYNLSGEEYVPSTATKSMQMYFPCARPYPCRKGNSN